MTFETASNDNHFLLVDDQPINLLTMSLILDGLGHSYDHAENGLVAVNKHQLGKYTAILMDIEMPVMNGYEACKQIRRYEDENNLPYVIIWIVTANPILEVQEKTADLKISEIMNKPFLFEDFKHMIQSIAA